MYWRRFPLKRVRSMSAVIVVPARAETDFLPFFFLFTGSVDPLAKAASKDEDRTPDGLYGVDRAGGEGIERVGAATAFTTVALLKRLIITNELAGARSRSRSGGGLCLSGTGRVECYKQDYLIDGGDSRRRGARKCRCESLVENGEK